MEKPTGASSRSFRFPSANASPGNCHTICDSPLEIPEIPGIESPSLMPCSTYSYLIKIIDKIDQASGPGTARRPKKKQVGYQVCIHYLSLHLHLNGRRLIEG